METLNIGDTSVTVRPDVTSITADKSRCSRATLVCKETLCRLEYRPNQRHANSAWINSIWLINDEPGFQHGALNAVAQVDAWQLGDPASRYLFCVERHTLHITLPESFTNPRVLPRRWNIGGTPNRLIYSKKFEQLLVGYTEAVVTENFRDNDSDVLTGKRRLYPMLGVVDPHEGNVTQIAAAEPFSNLGVLFLRCHQLECNRPFWGENSRNARLVSRRWSNFEELSSDQYSSSESASEER